MRSSPTAAPQPATRPPLRWTTWLLIVLVAGTITAAITYAVIRYLTYCGDCEELLRETVSLVSDVVS